MATGKRKKLPSWMQKLQRIKAQYQIQYPKLTEEQLNQAARAYMLKEMTKEKSNEMKVHDEKIQESITTKTIVLPLNLDQKASNIDNAKMNFSEKVCQFFLRGSCQRENCEFKHEISSKLSDMIDKDEVKDDSKNSKRANEENTSKSSVTKHKKVKYDIDESNESDQANSGDELIKAVAQAELKRQQQQDQKTLLDEDTAMELYKASIIMDASIIIENQCKNNDTMNQMGALQERKEDLDDFSQMNSMAGKKIEKSNSSKSKHNKNHHFIEKCEFCEKKKYENTKNIKNIKRYHIYSCHFKTEIDNEIDWKNSETVCPIRDCKYSAKNNSTPKIDLVKHYIGAKHGILDKYIEKKCMVMSKNTSSDDSIKGDMLDDLKNTKHANEENISKSNITDNQKVKLAKNESNEEANVNSAIEKVLKDQKTENKVMDESLSDPCSNSSVKICQLCVPNKNIEYDPEDEKKWFVHLMMSHFMNDIKAVLNNNCKDNYCQICMEDFSNADNSIKELKNHFISEHAPDVVENLYEERMRQKETEQDQNHMIGTNVEDVTMDSGGTDSHKEEVVESDAANMPTLMPSLPDFVSSRNGNSDQCLQKLVKIYTDVGKLIEGLHQFKGNRESKGYKYLDEMFTQNLLALDNLRMEGRNDKEKLKSFRKVFVKSINNYINILETKASDEEKMDTNEDKKHNKEIDPFVNDIEMKFQKIHEKSMLARMKTTTVKTQVNETQSEKSEIKTSDLIEFKCELCEKLYINANKLRKHKYNMHTIHTYKVKVNEGHKDFKCDNCGKSFSSKAIVKNHIKTVHDDLQQHKHKVHGILSQCTNFPINNSTIEAPNTLENHNKSFGSEELVDHLLEKNPEGFNQKKYKSNLFEDQGKFYGTDLLENQETIKGSKLVYTSKTPEKFNQKKRLQIFIKPIESMMNKKFINNEDENEMEFKKCLMCEETFSGVGDTFKKNWFQHLSNKKHFKKEFHNEIFHRIENDSLKCQDCEFTNPSNEVTNELGIHIVRKHGNAILQTFYDSEIESVADSNTKDNHETTKDSTNAQKINQEDDITKTDKDLEDQYDAKRVMASQNENLDSNDDIQRKFQVGTGSSENQQEKLQENDMVIVKNEANKLTTKIKIKINHDCNEEQRVIYIAKPPNYVTLYDVKEYLEKKPFFKVLKKKNLEFHAKYRESDGTTCLEEIQHDNLFLPNINGEIFMECWSVV